jgi:hypothetical protein
MSLEVAASGDHLVRGGSPFIVCADTVWSAFVDADLTEWRTYLRKRASQGFNSFLVSVLPIVHDRSVSPQSRAPWRRPVAPERDGRESRELDAAYLDTAVSLVDAAASEGLMPALVVAWYDYVAGERGRVGPPGQILGEGEMNAYLDAVTGAFAPYEPIYLVSGDEAFTSADAGPYPGLLRAVRARAPRSLTTLHTTPETTLPGSLTRSPDLSFYAYQSGHYPGGQELAIELAGRYLGLAERKPVMNLEPCYEGHGFGSGAGRFTAADVRRALWWSVFAGASAGIGYGAHGLWQWHRPGGSFNGTGFSAAPFPWDTALEFPGAWSAGLAAKLVADHGLYQARPAQDLVQAPIANVRAIATSDLSTVAVYTPYATDFTVAADLSSRVVTAIDLERGGPFRPQVSGAGPAARIGLPDFIGDALYVFAARS